MPSPQTAAQLGLSNPELRKLEGEGLAERVGTRKTGGRGRPSVLWLIKDGVDIEARPKRNGLDAAREARSSAASERIWEIVSKSAKEHNCKCRLRKGMTWDDLLALHAGCTSAHSLIHYIEKRELTDIEKRFGLSSGQGCVCPVLDQYRRLVGYPVRSPDDEIEVGFA